MTYSFSLREFLFMAEVLADHVPQSLATPKAVAEFLGITPQALVS